MRPRRHALTRAVSRSLPSPHDATARRFLDLLDRRLAALAAGGPIRSRPADLALARRFLARIEGSWDDGDEALVRGQLDRWSPAGGNAASDARARLLRAAGDLGAIRARPSTYRFFLWAMESAWAALAEGRDP